MNCIHNMKWVKFDYSTFVVKNDVEYFVYVQNKRTKNYYYHHIEGRKGTFYMTQSDADYTFNWNINEHEILYICELLNKIKKLLK